MPTLPPTDETHHDLLAQPAATLLPADGSAARLAHVSVEQAREVVAAHPTSSLGWAVLAEDALAQHERAGDVAGYAYARVGYHRGLDALRRAGWRGSGPVPWEHEPNRGFLRALWALAQAAGRIEERDEEARCVQLLRDSSETGYQVLSGR